VQVKSGGDTHKTASGRTRGAPCGYRGQESADRSQVGAVGRNHHPNKAVEYKRNGGLWLTGKKMCM